VFFLSVKSTRSTNKTEALTFVRQKKKALMDTEHMILKKALKKIMKDFLL